MKTLNFNKMNEHSLFEWRQCKDEVKHLARANWFAFGFCLVMIIGWAAAWRYVHVHGAEKMESQRANATAR